MNYNKNNDPSSHKHGEDFFNVWDEMFGLRTIPEQPGRYKHDK